MRGAVSGGAGVRGQTWIQGGAQHQRQPARGRAQRGPQEEDAKGRERGSLMQVRWRNGWEITVDINDRLDFFTATNPTSDRVHLPPGTYEDAAALAEAIKAALKGGKE